MDLENDPNIIAVEEIELMEGVPHQFEISIVHSKSAEDSSPPSFSQSGMEIQSNEPVLSGIKMVESNNLQYIKQNLLQAVNASLSVNLNDAILVDLRTKMPSHLST